MNLLQNMLKKNPELRYDIDQVLEHPWLQEKQKNEFSLNNLIKSFYITNNREKVLSQKEFQQKNLKDLICLEFKKQLETALRDHCKILSNLVQKINEVQQILELDSFLGDQENK